MESNSENHAVNHSQAMYVVKKVHSIYLFTKLIIFLQIFATNGEHITS